MTNGLFFTDVDELALNDLAAGKSAGEIVAWERRFSRRRTEGAFGVVLAKRDDLFEIVQPLAIAMEESSQRRLFGRFATLHEDLSPISAWCHIFDNRLLEAMADAERPAWLGGLEAAWSGLIIGEAALLADRPVEKLRTAACFATSGYAVARAGALWQRVQLDEVLSRHERLQNLIRGSGGSGILRLSTRLQPIWTALLAAAEGSKGPVSNLTAKAVRSLLEARASRRENEHLTLRELFSGWPEFDWLGNLSNAGPEERVRFFDGVVGHLRRASGRADERNVGFFVAAYLATIAAGGRPSIALAEGVAKEFPEILAWAYAIGGIGEPVSWASGFQGLGRFVSRELMRTFRIDDPPVCDFSFEEANYLVDKQLADPLALLKIKQQRFVTVALFPGVNVTVPFADAAEPVSVSPARVTEGSREPREADTLVNFLWPAIRQRLTQEGYSASAQAKAGGRKKGGQGKLPLEK